MKNLFKTIHAAKSNKLPLDRKKMKFWRPEEFKKFINLIPNDQVIFKTFYALAFFTGMRCGEMLALQWKDIDRILMEIDVRKSATYLNKFLSPRLLERETRGFI